MLLRPQPQTPKWLAILNLITSFPFWNPYQSEFIHSYHTEHVFNACTTWQIVCFTASVPKREMVSLPKNLLKYFLVKSVRIVTVFSKGE